MRWQWSGFDSTRQLSSPWILGNKVTKNTKSTFSLPTWCLKHQAKEMLTNYNHDLIFLDTHFIELWVFLFPFISLLFLYFNAFFLNLAERSSAMLWSCWRFCVSFLELHLILASLTVKITFPKTCKEWFNNVPINLS